MKKSMKTKKMKQFKFEKPLSNNKVDDTPAPTIDS